jgi:GntR family transcriptional regulator
LDTLPDALLERADFDLEQLRTESIYHILQTSLGRAVEYGIARVVPVVAPDHVAEKLHLPPNALTLYIVQTDYSSGDEPLVYSCEYHLPDAFDFLIWRRGSTY